MLEVRVLTAERIGRLPKNRDLVDAGRLYIAGRLGIDRADWRRPAWAEFEYLPVIYQQLPLTSVELIIITEVDIQSLCRSWISGELIEIKDKTDRRTHWHISCPR